MPYGFEYGDKVITSDDTHHPNQMGTVVPHGPMGGNHEVCVRLDSQIYNKTTKIGGHYFYPRYLRRVEPCPVCEDRNIERPDYLCRQCRYG
jgi:hypothetical protein